ncbi:acetyl-CoA carboxylase biotin carboxylase subunit family protein [Nocardia sp. NPDC052566]|uniref:acetyl-CoA carboxylase biotin carboxylase subunit family protein n=1 Tax=Nocardia sp. NPDC052566 TaxID=3364330 RepID=UPI0037C9A87C
MSTNSSNRGDVLSSADRATVVLLQARQGLGSVGVAEFAAAVAATGAGLLVLRTGEVPLVRDGDVALDGMFEERIAEIADWSSLIPAAATAIVTNDEYLLDVAPLLCGERGLTTTIPVSREHYRNKGIMRGLLESAGIAVAESLIVTAEGIETAGGCTGFGDDELVVVKPTAEANLRGIRIERFGDVEVAALGDGLVERLLTGPQYHSEVLVLNGVATHLFSGRYIRSLLDLTKGGPSGSARVDAETEEWLAALAVRACTALGLDGAFTAHVEYLSSGDDPADVVVSEICARASGGEVPFQSRVITGVDLELLNLSIQAGFAWPEPKVEAAASAGWLWRVGRPIDGAERIGDLAVEASFDRITLGGRARVRGESADEVMAALEVLAGANEG